MNIYKDIKPEISIILPTYNRFKYIDRAIKSILNQTFKNWELIIIDDGSNEDKTYKLVKDYINKNTNIRYIYQSNMKQSIARNVGIKLANSNYVCFIDSDDEYKSVYLSERLDFITKNNYDLIHGGIDVQGNQYISDKNDNSKLISISESISFGGTIFAKRQVLKSLGGFNENLEYAEDSDIIERATNKYNVGKISIASYVYHRGSENSITDKIESKFL